MNVRRILLRAAVAAVFIAVMVPAPAGAERSASLSDLQTQLDRLKSEIRKVGSAYDRAYWALDESQVRINKMDRRIASTRTKLADAKRRLNSHASSIYRRDALAEVAVLLTSASFEDFATRLDYMRRIGASDAGTIAEVKALSVELQQERHSLIGERRKNASAVASLKRQQGRLQSQLSAKQSAYSQVKAQIDAMRGGANRASGIAAVPGPNGMVFPVAGSNYYSDTWGASRGGGRRRHMGTDIFASRGTPVVAVLSGSVSPRNGGLGGKGIWLSAGNGWQIYYAHLDGWAVKSGHVRAGEVVGYVGNTGDAAGGACHLHIQIQPPGHGYVNPYPYLRSLE